LSGERAVYESNGFDKDMLNRSMKMTAPTMGPHTNFKDWKSNFLNCLSLKAAYLIPHFDIRESGMWFDEGAHNYAFALLMHVVSENHRANHAVKCLYVARHEYTTATWDIICERVR
jgi:hypothetical protein